MSNNVDKAEAGQETSLTSEPVFDVLHSDAPARLLHSDLHAALREHTLLTCTMSSCRHTPGTLEIKLSARKTGGETVQSGERAQVADGVTHLLHR